MRHAVISVLLIALSTAGSASAAPPSAASSPAVESTAGPAPKIPPADQKRMAAIQQYQRDLVNVVALRADPEYLLGAAVLAKPFRNQTPGLDFDALSQRAAAAPGAGPATAWVRLGVCQDKSDCPNAEADAYLKKHAAGNAAVWLVDFDLAAANKDVDAEGKALARAAAAQTYDDYYGKVLAGVAKAVQVLPPLADTTQGAHGGQPDDAAGVRLFVAVSAMQSHLRPNLEPVIEWCDKHAVDKHAERKADCLKVAHTLQWGSSPVARAVGLHIDTQLDPDAGAQDDRASRDLAWQVHQYSGLLQRALTDSSIASQWLAAARNGGTELSLMLATLRANQVPLEAPAGAVAPASATSGGR